MFVRHTLVVNGTGDDWRPTYGRDLVGTIRMNAEIKIRRAAHSDAADCLELYRPSVEQCAISFEDAAPAQDEMAARIVKISAQLPAAGEELQKLSTNHFLKAYGARGTSQRWPASLCQIPKASHCTRSLVLEKSRFFKMSVLKTMRGET